MTDQKKNDTTTTPPKKQVDEVKRMRKFANYMKANVSCATVTFASRKMEAFKGKYFVEQLKKYENGKASKTPCESQTAILAPQHLWRQKPLRKIDKSQNHIMIFFMYVLVFSRAPAPGAPDRAG